MKLKERLNLKVSQKEDLSAKMKEKPNRREGLKQMSRLRVMPNPKEGQHRMKVLRVKRNLKEELKNKLHAKVEQN